MNKRIYIYDRAQVDRWFIRKVNYRLAFVWGEDSENGVNDQPDNDNTKPLPVIYDCNRLHI